MSNIRWIELGAIMLLIGVLAAVLLPALARSREAARRSSCQNNLKQLGLVVKMYSGESRGERFPPVSRLRDNWMMDGRAVYPEYLTDPMILVCPSSPFFTGNEFRLTRTPRQLSGKIHECCSDCIWSQSYLYTGFTVIGDARAIGLFNAYQAAGNLDAIRDNDMKITVPVWKEAKRDDTHNFSQSQLPVFWDRLGPDSSNHIPRGSNVLLMDGHTEFVRYSPYNTPNNFPVTKIAVDTFGASAPALPLDCTETE